MKLKKLMCFVVVMLGCIAIMPQMSFSQEETEQSQPSRQDRIYRFEHRFLPGLVHYTDIGFFDDLKSGDFSKIRNAAEEMVDKKFLESFKIDEVLGGRAFLVSFETPVEMAECYYVLIEKDGEGFNYYTLEKTMDVMGTGIKTAVCMWSADGAHYNMGFRKYTDSDNFIEDIQSGLDDEE